MQNIKYLIFIFMLTTCMLSFSGTNPVSKNNTFFTIDCSIFSRNGKLIYRPTTTALFCAFHKSGSVLMSNPMLGYLMMLDKNDKVLWKSREVAHHKISFTPDQKNIMIISSEVISHNKKMVRSDCFSIRDLNNKKIHEWCASKHLKELTALGFDMNALWDIDGDNNNFYYNENVDQEITHANSFYQIPPNSSKNPAFKAGNYMVHLYGEARPLLILDSKLEKILWHMDVSEFLIDYKLWEIDSHALQVTPEGTILAYFSEIIDKDTTASLYVNALLNINMPITTELEYRLNLKRLSMHSRLVEFDPSNKNILWQYKRHPLQKFYSPVFGWVHHLDDDTFFFNEMGKLNQINRDGQTQWSFTNPVINNNTRKPMKIIDTVPFTDRSFFESRDINPE